MHPCTSTEAPFWHRGSVQAPRTRAGTEGPYRPRGSVQAPRLPTGTETPYRHRGSVQATEVPYRHWGSVLAPRLRTGTEAPYRHWGSVLAPRHRTGTEGPCRHRGFVQAPRVRTSPEAPYRHRGSLQALRLRTGTETLYRHWGSVQALRLCTGHTAHRGSRGIALLCHDRGTRRRWGVSVTPRPLFTPGKDPVPIVQEAGWVPGRSGQVRKISFPTGIRSRTVHPVASRYTNYVTQTTKMYPYTYNISHKNVINFVRKCTF